MLSCSRQGQPARNRCIASAKFHEVYHSNMPGRGASALGNVERSRKVRHGLAQDEHTYMCRQTPLVLRTHPVAQIVLGLSTGNTAVALAFAVKLVGARHLVHVLVPEQEADGWRVFCHPLGQPPRLRANYPPLRISSPELLSSKKDLRYNAAYLDMLGERRLPVHSHLAW